MFNNLLSLKKLKKPLFFILFLFFSHICAAFADDENDFFVIDVDVNKWAGTPLDFSYLNRKITAADRVNVRGGYFYTLGKDLAPGTADDARVKFFGVNLAFSGNFPDKAEADLLAKRLGYLGVNLVRLHHIDTVFSGKDAAHKEGILSPGKFPTFDSQAVARLKYLVDRFADAGIYVNINLHVGYTFDPVRDELTSFPADFKFPPKSKPLQIIFPELVQRQKQYACSLIDGLKLKNSPVMAMVEINNESSIIDSWQKDKLDIALLGKIYPELTQKWIGFQKGEDFPVAQGLVSFDDPNISKKARFARFLAELDRAYLDDLYVTVKQCAGELVPVTGTQMGFGGLINQYSHAKMDYLDNHFYIDHYEYFEKDRAADWSIGNISILNRRFYPLLGVALLREKGKPYTISEFNQAWPNESGQDIDLVTSAFALIQDWDGLMHFNYSNTDRYAERIPRGFNLHGDPSRLAAFGQSARIFREYSVVEPTGHYTFSLKDTLYMAAKSIRQWQLNDMLLDMPKGINNLNMQISSSVGESTSKNISTKAGSKDVVLDARKKQVNVALSDVWALTGIVDKGTIRGDNIMVEYPGRHPLSGMVVLSSIDRKPIKKSSRMLLTMPGPTWRSLQKADQNIPELLTKDAEGYTFKPQEGSLSKARSVSLQEGNGPVWMQLYQSVIKINTGCSANTPLSVYQLDGAGQRSNKLKSELVACNAGYVTINLQSAANRKSPWYELVRE